MDIGSIRSNIDKALDRRREMLPSIARRENELKNQLQLIDEARAGISRITQFESDSGRIARINGLSSPLDSLFNEIENNLASVSSLRTRFERSTVCIGVSGMARVGKSTTLQRMSGLTDEQIPTGNRQNVTAVHSIIHNYTDGNPYAGISFLTEQEFVEDYLTPLIEDVNDVLSENGKLKVPLRLQDLLELTIPDTLGRDISSTAADSLKRLHDAKDCIDSYKDYLSAAKRIIPLEDQRLDEFKQFVAYPEDDSPEANRAYLAVKDVEIYCPFPSIPGVRLSLVDLPGFGEINVGVAKGHVAALNTSVDHILDILKPQDTSGSMTQADGHALDLLYKVQPEITSRRSLITVGINIFDEYVQNAEKLREDFSKRYNLAQDEPLNIKMYHANDPKSVFSVFNAILTELAVNLPTMDRELLEETYRQANLTDHRKAIESLRDTLSVLMDSIPLPEKVINDEILSISSKIISACQQYENELATTKHGKSESKAKFDEQVDECSTRVQNELEDGFFLGQQAWEERARGQSDYYAYYRAECRRIRREIIACYEGLDDFYEENTDRFKNNVLDTIFSNTGSLYAALGAAPRNDINAAIDSLKSLLAPIARGTGILPALELLKLVRFSFRHNVFLNIAPHLDELLNPYERKSRYASDANEKIIALGGIGDPSDQVEKLQRYLFEIGGRANLNTSEALKNAEDRFSEYLSVCMSFFIDYLWRMDVGTFRQVFVRKILIEYPNAVVGHKASKYQNADRIDAYASAIRLLDKLATELTGGRLQSHATIELPSPSRQNPSKHLLDSLDVGDVIDGKIIRITGTGVLVALGAKREGLIPMSSFKRSLGINEFIDNPADYFSKDFMENSKIRVRVEKLHEDGKIDLAMARKCV